MKCNESITRRGFLERLGAGALLGAGLCRNRLTGASDTASWTPPPVLKNPNMLVIMVDQLRPPMWMDGFSQPLTQALPNIAGQIQNCSYNFSEFYVAATVCIPSRSAMLTGLYAPQVSMYVTSLLNAVSTPPALNPAYPTWGQALAALNPAYQGNVWWFGKWHVCPCNSRSPLQAYGFQTSKYPGGSAPPYNPSPNGAANEGTDGGQYGNLVWANDSMIAGDFTSWLVAQPSNGGPWCATVSFVNPHDITYAPAWLTSSLPPDGVPQPLSVYFPAPVGPPPNFYSNPPSSWNYENLTQIPNKPSLQLNYLTYLNKTDWAVTDWVLFLNQYFWLQQYVDQQIGSVLDALEGSAFANNTIVLFLSDHGEYAGSHGLHTKGFGAYDESIRVPLCVRFPGQATQIPMNQMCSAVDFFGLICDLATGGSGQWALAYPDLADRQSIWSFLYNNSSETRVAPAPVGLPYVLHTCDEGGNVFANPHITCLRTKHDPNAGAIGAKLAFYRNWTPCTTYPDASPPQPEFYDYNPQTANNTAETGNDYYSNNATTQNTIEQYQQILGNWGAPGTPGTGIIANELNAPLIGTGTDGNPLTQAQAIAQQNYINYVNGACG
ncbi:MAG TPA: sulfatase-like hydrolase/transferase [Bryobacteraceae bacterium]|nr:sulfatase-like hydrolase/transferase [Bryobacteraceae bacterium]